MAKAKAKIVTKAKKKEWVPIIAPKVFSEQYLGDIHIEDPKKAMGRNLQYNLKALTRNPKDQGTHITFEIKGMQGEKLTTKIVGYSMGQSSIKRLVRKNTLRVDDSFTVETDDGKKLKIKSFVLTAFKGQHLIGTSIRKDTRKYLRKEIGKINFGNLIDKLISYKIQTDLKKKLNDIYPIKFAAIREMKLIGESEGAEKDKKTKKDTKKKSKDKKNKKSSKKNKKSSKKKSDSKEE